MAYLIKDGNVIATLETMLKSGTQVQFAYITCKEQIDQSRDFNLVNAKTAKVSYSKKWDRVFVEHSAIEINTNEFLLR